MMYFRIGTASEKPIRYKTFFAVLAIRKTGIVQKEIRKSTDTQTGTLVIARSMIINLLQR